MPCTMLWCDVSLSHLSTGNPYYEGIHHIHHDHEDAKEVHVEVRRHGDKPLQDLAHCDSPIRVPAPIVSVGGGGSSSARSRMHRRPVGGALSPQESCAEQSLSPFFLAAACAGDENSAVADSISSLSPPKPAGLLPPPPSSVDSSAGKDGERAPPWLLFFTHPVAVTLFLNHWTYGWIGFLVLTELPSYLTDDLGMYCCHDY
jgi:hypothetical protein